MSQDTAVKTRTGATVDAAAQSCRLCGGATAPTFRIRVLSRYDVACMACGECGSLQTEAPYWLDEAYGAPRANDGGEAFANLNGLDTGAAQRNIKNMAATLTVARKLKLANAIDIGGGDGLLCRLLRDYGLNAYVSDRYASASYAQGFEQPDFAVADLVTAFEVFEHFADPQAEVAQVFAGRPKAVLITTELYTGQGSDWWYLIPETGHHIFFYAERALQMIAERFGYDLVRAGSFTLFVAKGASGRAARTQLSLMLRGKALKLVRALLSFEEPVGVMADHARARATAGAADR